MRQYLDTLRLILDSGNKKSDRTGTGTISYFGPQMRFDLSKGFPLVTTKKVFLRGIIEELLWMLRGETNVRSLQEQNVHIWDEWADEKGELGPVYGHQWRKWSAPRFIPGQAGNGDWIPDETVIEPIDQIKAVIARIVAKPDDRRLIVCSWNVADIEKMKLPPCHCFFQFYVADGKLSCHLYQRSADMFLGVPFNIASYALLTMMVAQVTGLVPGEFVHTFGDAHIYLNHMDQVKLQLSREPRPLPKMDINPEIKNIFEFKPWDFELSGYDPHPAIKAEVAV